MLRSLYSAVSGLDVNQKSMDVIGNNIANVNTIGFKEGRAVFQDLMSQTLIGGKTPTDARGGINPRQVGSGAYLAAVDNIFEPGILKATSRTADLAIQGNGLFVVRGEGDQERYYTRAGDFNFDRTGTLTNPSGYKVQGWMSDPTTGKLINEGAVGDIVLGPAYKVMQAKSSSEINLVGNLDTRAQSSILSYPKFLTQAAAQQSIMSTTDGAGKSMDLAKGETVKIKAHATGITSMKDMFNSSDNPLNLTEGNDITFTFPADSKVPTFSLTYRSAAGAGGNDFNTVQEFIDAANRNLVDKTVVPNVQMGTMSISNGRLTISGNGSFNLTSISGNSIISSALVNLQGQYGVGHSKESEALSFIKEIKAGENFNSLTELAMQVENAINGTVVPGDFNVDYLTNNFGLLEGEGLQMSVLINGVATTIPAAPLVYTESETPDATIGQFHTVNEMATLLKDAINGAAGVDIVNVGLVGNKITMTYVGAVGAPTLAFGATTLTPGPGAGAPNPNPYLANLLNGSLDGKTLTSANAIHVDEISGKGRLVYSNDNAQAITGFVIDKSLTGDVFDKNVTSHNTIGANSSMTSGRFLAQADENSKLVDLFTMNGESFNFTENEATLLFNASVGGGKITSNNVFNIQVGTTILDLMASMEDFLGLGRAHNSHQNVVMKDGSIVVTGEEGEDNAIDYFRFDSALSKNNIFTKHMNAEVKQKASGGVLPTAVEIFDEQGNLHTLNVRFSLWNKEQNEWRMEVKTTDPMTSVAINGATTNELTIKFNSDGSMAYMYDRFTDPSTIIVNPSLRFTAANGTNSIENIALNLGTQGERDGLTLSAAPGGFTTNETDGYPQGALEERLFTPAGEIVGSYTNGEVRVLGQLALATFSNQQGLLKVGDTMFAETGNSGRATFGTAQTGGRGDINAGMLENSNVDLSRELVSMITTQRGFQASSKIISTSDEMIQELLAMKR